MLGQVILSNVTMPALGYQWKTAKAAGTTNGETWPQFLAQSDGGLLIVARSERSHGVLGYGRRRHRPPPSVPVLRSSRRFGNAPGALRRRSKVLLEKAVGENNVEADEHWLVRAAHRLFGLRPDAGPRVALEVAHQVRDEAALQKASSRRGDSHDLGERFIRRQACLTPSSAVVGFCRRSATPIS